MTTATKEIYYYHRYQTEYTAEQLWDIGKGICKPYFLNRDIVAYSQQAVIGRQRGDMNAKLWFASQLYRKRTRWY